MKYYYILIVMMFVLSCDQSLKDTISGSGVIEGTEILLSSQATGQIIDMNVAEGAAIQQGALIARIDDDKLAFQKEHITASLDEIEFHIKNAQAAISQTEENYRNIEKQHQRISALFNSGSATQQQIDNIETQYKNARTQLTSARNNLQAVEMKNKQLTAQLKLVERQIEDCRITAPATGIIVEKYVEQGELAAVGLPVVSIVDLSKLWIKLYVTEPELGFVKLGASGEIKIDSYRDKTFAGTIVWISPKAEFTPHNVQTKEARADLVYAVKLTIPNPEGILKIGMPADIFIKKHQ